VASTGIAKRIALAAVAVTMSIVFTIGFISFLSMRSNMQAQFRQQMNFESKLVRGRLEALLESINHEVKSTAENLIFVNALIDSEGRDFYIKPFLQSYKLPEQIPFTLTLCDFEGKPINSSSDKMPEYHDYEMVSALINEEKPYARLRHEGEENLLLIAHPVFYGATAMAEGMLVIEVPIGYLFDLALAPLLIEGASPFVKAAGILWVDAEHEHRYMMRPESHENKTRLKRLARTLELSEPLKSLGLSFSMFDDDERVYRPLKMMALKYLLAGVLILGITYIVSQKIAVKLIQPLTELTRYASKVSFEARETDMIETGADDEVGILAKTFNTMVKRLRESHESLEKRVRERTEELEEVNSELVREIAEREKAEDRIKQALREKEILLSEIHHRVKNNMAIISALLSLQSNYTDDEETIEMLSESQRRIHSMALVHEKLYKQHDDFASIDFHDYAESLTDDLLRSHGRTREDIKVTTDIDDIALPLDILIPCGLIINELINNSLKHAFRDALEPGILISLKREDDKVVLVVGDTGSGLPEDKDLKRSKSLGLKIVNQLIRQIEGHLEIDRSKGTGFKISLSLPEKKGSA